MDPKTMTTKKMMKVRDLLLKLTDFDLDLPIYIGNDRDDFVTELKSEARVYVDEVEQYGTSTKAIVIEP